MSNTHTPVYAVSAEVAGPPFRDKGGRQARLEPDTHSCRCSGNVVWSAYADERDTWIDHLEQIQEWLKLHNLDPCTIRSAAVVIQGSGLELHVEEYLTCPQHADARYVDWATNDMATRTRVLPLISEPPALPHRAGCQQYAVSAEDARRYRSPIEELANGGRVAPDHSA